MEGQKSEGKFPMNAVRVCVDRYGGYDAAGRLYSKQISRGMEFYSIADLLLRTDRILDSGGWPQSFQEKRSFQGGKTGPPPGQRAGGVPRAGRIPVALTEDEVIEEQRGRLETYDLIIQSRMHASWQGFVRDGTGRFLGAFESELQLMQIMMEHLYHYSDMSVFDASL